MVVLFSIYIPFKVIEYIVFYIDQCLIWLVHFMITCQNLPILSQCVHMWITLSYQSEWFGFLRERVENCRGTPTFLSCCLVTRDVNFHLDVNFIWYFDKLRIFILFTNILNIVHGYIHVCHVVLSRIPT